MTTRSVSLMDTYAMYVIAFSDQQFRFMQLAKLDDTGNNGWVNSNRKSDLHTNNCKLKPNFKEPPYAQEKILIYTFASQHRD